MSSDGEVSSAAEARCVGRRSEQLLLSFGLLESLLPGGSELEQAIGGPSLDEAEQIADVAVRLDAVEARTGEQRDEVTLAKAPSSLPRKSQFRRHEDEVPELALGVIVRRRDVSLRDEGPQLPRDARECPRTTWSGTLRATCFWLALGAVMARFGDSLRARR
jgi:hypothetical protein